MFDLKDIRKKLDIVLNLAHNVENLIKRIKHEQSIDSVVITKIALKLDKLLDKSSFYFSKIQINNVIIEGRIDKITMNEFQKVKATFTAKKKNGQPAQVQNPRADTDDPDVLTGEITGENEATFTAVEGGVTEPVAVLCRVIADADLGEGVREIEIVGSVTVTPGEAETLEMTFGEPEDK